jgi:hypothetical protein
MASPLLTRRTDEVARNRGALKLGLGQSFT